MPITNAKRAIVSVSGTNLTKDECILFQKYPPLGFILFKRNIVDLEQVQGLIKQLKECIGRDNLLFLVDQEGGRVARLSPPNFSATSSAGFFGTKAREDLESAKKLAYEEYYSMALQLKACGFNIDCFPLGDLLFEGASNVIGDRSFGSDIKIVESLCRVADSALKAAKIQSVLKHIPGHGRAIVDSHFKLPIVDADLETLESSDFKVFSDLRDFKVAMTAHIIFKALDNKFPTTISRNAIDYIREKIGFHGILLTDCISMKAISEFGTIGEIANMSLEAGCDIVLYCPGDMSGNEAVLESVSYACDSLWSKIESLAWNENYTG